MGDAAQILVFRYWIHRSTGCAVSNGRDQIAVHLPIGQFQIRKVDKRLEPFMHKSQCQKSRIYCRDVRRTLHIPPHSPMQ
uniref:Uncharacterized protein n=1 Tax=Peronospora matthiolae TaxID=2874970 RepID=A0AAV1U448_9STRA